MLLNNLESISGRFFHSLVLFPAVVSIKLRVQHAMVAIEQTEIDVSDCNGFCNKRLKFLYY